MAGAGALVVLSDGLLKAFPPVAADDARTLVLGSMPGEASLRAGQYYAHPRNAFWFIMAELTGVPAEATYAERLDGLRRAGIALWDVLHACEREGSLDAAIVDATSVPNDFAAFFRAHPGIRRVVFNGAKAEHCFRRQVLASQSLPPDLTMIRAPSTSPAHAAMTSAEKRRRWFLAICPDRTVHPGNT